MEKQKKKSFLDNKTVKVTITLVMIAGLIAISYDLFLSPESPEEVEISIKEKVKEIEEKKKNWEADRDEWNANIENKIEWRVAYVNISGSNPDDEWIRTSGYVDCAFHDTMILEYDNDRTHFRCVEKPIVTEPVIEIPVVQVVPSHDADNHTHDAEITMIPMTILDMVHFLNDHPEISDDDSMVLMSYAVAKETGMDVDKEVDHLAYHIMENLI